MSTPESTPTPTLPPEVREAIATTARALFGVGPDRDNFVAVTTEEMEAALAPLWPRPVPVDPKELHAYIKRHLPGYTLIHTGEVKAQAQASSPDPVTADARELAERIRDAIFHKASHWDAETERIAAVLSPVVARLKQAEDELRESPGHLLRRARNAEARAEAAERERDQLRAEVTAAILDLHAAQKQAREALPDKERLDWLEELYSTTDNTNPTWQQFLLAVAMVGYRAAIDAARKTKE